MLNYNKNDVHVPEMLTIVEVAKKTGLSYYALRKGCMSGEIIHIRLGNKYLINFDKLIEQLNGGGKTND